MYINKNTVMQKQATNEFGKNFYKLLSNACYGKTMENFRNRRLINFVQIETQANSLSFKPKFKSFNIINANLVSVVMNNTKNLWIKPTPVGAATLDLSKLTLYGFHYKEMKPRYGDSITVVYKDTDSLLYRVETNNLYSDMGNLKHLFDLSDYPTSHPLFDASNIKVPLTMTDKLLGKVLKEMVCLRSKPYSIKFNGGVKQSAKGVQKSVKKSLHHEAYHECLFKKTTMQKEMTQLRSEDHQIIVKRLSKVALSAFDDKRFFLGEGIQSVAYGHVQLNQFRGMFLLLSKQLRLC